jgi:hypothetical protein
MQPPEDVLGMQVLIAFLLLSGVVLGGCADGGRGGGSDPGGNPQCDGAVCSAESEALDGLVLEVVRTDSGRDHRLDATARNTGWEIFWFLWVPQCSLDPWGEEMVGPSGPALPREPGVHCLPCGWDALSPGETMSKSYTWDERVWDVDDGTSRQAPEGRYVWSVHFYAAHSEDQACGSDERASVAVWIDV